MINKWYRKSSFYSLLNMMTKLFTIDLSKDRIKGLFIAVATPMLTALVSLLGTGVFPTIDNRKAVLAIGV